MDVKAIDVYAACDKAIQAMNRENLEAFQRLKGMDLSGGLIRTVTALYRAARKRAKKRYYEVGFEAYLLAMAMCGEEPKKAHQQAEKAITEEWVDRILAETDMVALYRFDTETERKAYRLAETLEVAADRNREIDKALKAWSQQVGQFAINVTDYAMMEAYTDFGLEEVEWVSERDQRVCGECHSYDGKIFPLDEVPPKPHWGCRCRLVSVNE